MSWTGSRMAARRALPLLLAALLAANTRGAEDALEGTLAGADMAPPDPEGLSRSAAAPSRGPNMLLYAWPFVPPAWRDGGKGWRWRADAEAGWLLQDGEERAAGFNNYRDWRQGPLLSRLGVAARHEDGGFLDLRLASPGRENQRLLLNAGRREHFQVKAFHLASPREFSRQSRTLFEGAGSGDLRLPAGLQAGNNPLPRIQEALANAGPVGLSINRRQTGLDLSFALADKLSLLAGASLQQREGARPFGGAFFPPFYATPTTGGVVETIEPVDYQSRELRAGLRFAGAAWQANLDYHASFFANREDSLSFDNPFINLPGSDAIVPRGRFALYPDNAFHQVKVDVARALPWRGRLIASAAWSRLRQDDDLLPPTINAGPTFTGIDLDAWNSRQALPEDWREPAIDQSLLQVDLQVAPWSRLSLRGRLRFDGEDNDTDYRASNPLTGQTGYVPLDGAYTGGLFQPGQPQPPLHYRSVPFASDRLSGGLAADYRLSTSNRLSLEYRNERREYAHRERDRSTEHGLALSLTNRALPRSTLRLSLEQAERHGDRYDSHPYEAFYSSSLPGFVPVLPQGPRAHTLAELRKFDIADRRQRQVSLKLTLLPRDDMDLSLNLDWRDTRYEGPYGLRAEDGAAMNLDWHWRPGADLNAYAFLGLQQGGDAMANANDSGFAGDPRVGGANYPLEATWRQTSDDEHHTAGLGLRYQRGRLELDSHVVLARSRTGLDYFAASSAALANPGLPGGSGSFPDIEYRRQVWDTSLRWRIDERLALRLYHRFEHGATDDWHYRGLEPLMGNRLFLNAVPEDFSVHVVGLLAQYRWE